MINTIETIMVLEILVQLPKTNRQTLTLKFS